MTTGSSGRPLITATFAGGLVVFDAASETTHVLDATAAWLFTHADSTSFDALVDEASSATGGPRELISSDLRAGISQLRALGILGRPDGDEDQAPWPGSDRPRSGRHMGSLHPVLDDRLAFRSHDPVFLGEIDAFFGGGVAGDEPTVFVDVDLDSEGDVLVTAESEWRFPNRGQFFAQIVNVVNEYAARTGDLPVLHAGAVRTPHDEVVVLPGTMNAGKSTLVAALVQAGCDYLGDEAIGIRPGSRYAVGYPKPINLDETSRVLLGLEASERAPTPPREVRTDAVRLHGDVGPIGHLVLATYDPDQRPGTTTLDALQRLRALLANTLNLARAGSIGLQTLCDLASAVPATRLVHGDARAVATRLAGDGLASITDPSGRG